MLSLRNQVFICLLSVPFLYALAAVASCPKTYVSPSVEERLSVYANTPYKSGELARYEIKYMGVLVGYGDLSVKPARKYNRLWSQVLFAEGRTGDWYKALFVAHDKIESISNPVNMEAMHFYIDQDEGKLFGSRYQRKKWLKFDHQNCKVSEKVEDKNSKKKREDKEFELVPGTLDVLTAAYILRTKTYKVGKVETAPVYTSEKNWELKIEPVAQEVIAVPAGKFKTMKLKLTTYIGEELQQKGDIHIWIDTERPERPIVKIEGEIKIGHVEMSLKEFTHGA